MIHAYAARTAGGPLEPFEYEPKPLGEDEVEIRVAYCGICHSDLSMLDNDWHMTAYPFVPGHEVVGQVQAVGPLVKHLKPGQWAGLGWYSRSCTNCRQCVSGDANLCPTAEATMLGRHGGFADRVRAAAHWVMPLPDKLDPARCGPLFCGGITVFNPIVQFNVRPTDRVGVIGIGGLGHMALQMLDKWGCDVTAFTSSDSKRDEALQMGADHVVNSRNSDELARIAGSLDFILSTVNVELDWNAYMNTLAPRGRLHSVGAVDKPFELAAFPMIIGQKSLSASPLGSPSTCAMMLDFCSRHGIAPVTEMFPMSKVNDAMQHLRDGKARYRIVLKRDA